MQSYFIIYTLWIAYDHNSMLIQVNFGLTSALKLSKSIKTGPKPQTGATAGTGRTTGRYTGRPALTYSYSSVIFSPIRSCLCKYGGVAYNMEELS